MPRDLLNLLFSSHFMTFLMESSLSDIHDYDPCGAEPSPSDRNRRRRRLEPNSVLLILLYFVATVWQFAMEHHHVSSFLGLEIKWNQHESHLEEHEKPCSIATSPLAQPCMGMRLSGKTLHRSNYWQVKHFKTQHFPVLHWPTWDDFWFTSTMASMASMASL